MTDSNLEKRYADNHWDAKADYFDGCRVLLHNEDYLEFLVSRVWKIDQPCRIVDFGCGSGRFGQMLMPFMPEGSSYTGIDQSAELIAEARKRFTGAPFEAEFYVGDVHEVPFGDDSFDVAVSHAVLMHIPDPMGAIREMIRVTVDGGLVVTCDANRNAHQALFHVEELNTRETTPLELLQTMNREIRLQTGVDHNIGIKTPVLMHKAGLRDVQARMSDCVRLLFPPVDDPYKETLFRAICDEGYGVAEPDAEGRARWKANMMKYSVSEEDAEREIDRELAQDFLGKGREYYTVYASLLSFSFGRADKDRD